MTPDERRLYDEWHVTAKPLLDEKKWTEALKGVPTLTLTPAQPYPMSVPLSQATIALVTSAGFSGPGQEPMDGPNPEGDYTIRVLDVNWPNEQLLTTHTHFNTEAAREDVNVVYPIDRLKELAADGVIGAVAPQAVSFMGYFSNVFRMRDEVVPAIVDAVKASGAHGVVLVPV